MGKDDRAAPPAPPELDRFLRWALFRLRWASILLLLLLTFMQPTLGRGGLATWALVLLFAGYNLLVELLRNLVPRLRSYTVVALLDLPIVGLLYGLGAEPGGPLFLLLFLAADCAAVSLPLRAAVLYTGAVAAIAVITDVVLLMWSPVAADIRLLVVRLTMLGLVTVGMAILTRRLAMEQEAARAVRDVNERLLVVGLREQEAARADRLEAERLEALDRLRADFIATVSHDLRTPLTAARAGLAMLEMRMAEQLGSDDRELLETSRRNVEYLHILIGDLLTFNQLEAGVLRLDRAPLDLRAVEATAMRAERTRGVLVERSGLPHPVVHRRCVDAHAALGEQLGHVGVTQAVADIPPHGERDDVRREALPGERRPGQRGEAAATVEALADLSALTIPPIIPGRCRAATWTDPYGIAQHFSPPRRRRQHGRLPHHCTTQRNLREAQYSRAQPSLPT